MNGTEELRKKYLKFFEKKNHKIIESYSLIPDNDPSVLFTTAGMHPLVPFLMGHKHSMGARLVNVQKCIRTGDIDEVGDDVHFTFFEMLGNWSLGDYFKEESIRWSYEFLTKELGLKKENLAFSCFEGDESVPRDEESYKDWIKMGISKSKIVFLGKKDNWWGPAGKTGPCGPDTEIFYWNSDEKVPDKFDPNDSNWVEIWNNVFMEYEKIESGEYIPLKQKNVDTGMGLERVAMILEGVNNVYEIENIKVIFDKVKEIAGLKELNKNELKSVRIIVDHMRAATFILGDNKRIVPSNLDQGYVLRKLIRRVVRHLYLLRIKGNPSNYLIQIAKIIIKQFSPIYFELKQNEKFILDELNKEGDKFNLVIKNGLDKIHKQLEKVVAKIENKQLNKMDSMEKFQMIMGFKDKKIPISLDSEWLFNLYQTDGMPPEMTLEEIKDAYNKKVPDEEKLLNEFQELFKKHQALSRVGAEKRFKGGLSENSDMTKRLHTATHLLNEVLRRVLREDIKQRGSNITPERLRFDFNFERKLTDDEKKKIEYMLNDIIKKGISVKKELMTVKDAFASGAHGEFGTKYPEKVWVYTIGDFSKEICNGPHVENTNELGKFKIKKEQSSGAGVRRIKAVLVER